MYDRAVDRRLMKHTTEKQSLSRPGASMSSILTLAHWQLRETWRLLVLTGAGMVIATVLVCTLPLYSEVALSAGLRAVLNASPVNSSLLVQGSMRGPSAAAIPQVMQQLRQALHKNLGAYVNLEPQFFAQLQRAGMYRGNTNQRPGEHMELTDSAVALQA